MSSVLRMKLQERALTAEKMLEQLQPCLCALRKAAVVQLCGEEQTRLTLENECLKQQLALLLKKLRSVEEDNGVKQVYVAQPAGSGEVTSTVTSSSSSCDAGAHDVPAAKIPKAKKPVAKAAPAKAGDTAAAPPDISKLLLKVGQIVEVVKHPDADSLYVETVDLAEERPRTIVSGLVKHVPIEEMRNRLAVFACNLKPAKMRGVLSEGMIMCASTPEKVQVIDVPAGAAPGDRVTFSEYPGDAEIQLNPKKKIWEALVPDLKTNEGGVATYKGCPFTITGKGVCQAPGCPNFPIK